LIGNAIKYTSKAPQARIEICAANGEPENTYCIRDNGIGFDMKYADKLFSVFQRLHSSDDFEGTGIGLAIVKRIVERHGGRVWAEGRLNEGASIYFTLPPHENLTEKAAADSAEILYLFDD
jgi:light-regulated signal transduction histidine kinase (bacteriophytochrome)